MLNLKDLNVLIARPKEVAQDLVQQISDHGGTSICQPLFATQSLLDTAMITQLSIDLAINDFAVFISRNAVELVLPHIAAQRKLIWACVGPATANFLESAGIKNCIYPQQAPYDSQALIAEIKRRQIDLTNKRVLIITGQDGDGWLAQAFQDNGAIVNTLAVYKRVMPDIEAGVFIRLFNNAKSIDIILITCVTSLINLQILAKSANLEIKDLPLLVVSERIRKHAIEMGHKNVYTSASMSDSDIMSGLLLAYAKPRGE